MRNYKLYSLFVSFLEMTRYFPQFANCQFFPISSHPSSLISLLKKICQQVRAKPDATVTDSLSKAETLDSSSSLDIFTLVTASIYIIMEYRIY